MYKIIGADGKEYGPITAEQVRQWVAEGRANAQTKVQPQGATEWRPLSEIPELASAATFPPPPGSIPPDAAMAANQASGPAIGMIVTGILSILVSLTRIVVGMVGYGARAGSTGSAEIDKLMAMSGTLGGIFGAIGVVLGVVILMGGIKMKKLESRGFCLTAAILAVIPCTSPCCIVGVPIGIWALVVLSKPEVKNAFH